MPFLVAGGEWFMLFTSNIFLFLFLPIVLIGYYALYRRKARNLFLFLASLFFYAWGETKFVFIMLAVIALNYRVALAIDKKRGNRNMARLILALTVVVNLSVLFYYKYFNFTLNTLNRFGLGIPLKNIVLPIGISFFIFQALSYVVDVYRGTVPAQTDFIHVGLYISLFPQLVAGPIVRYGTIAEQIENREETISGFSEGIGRFITGFAKKMLLANNMALIADKAFALPDAERSVSFAWLGAVAYSLQILFDFSGYSDMAIGLGRMFAFRFLENFNYPYIAKSISEFWRRWHISLGSWFRDYVYFPLGGSRVKSGRRLVFNLFAVWALTGAWHGASWNFIAWGLFYFVIITFEKLSGLPGKFKNRPARALYQVFTLFAVCGGWVLFRAPGFRAAVKYGMTMFGLRGNPIWCVNTSAAIREYRFFLIAALVCSTPALQVLKEWIKRRNSFLKFAADTIAVGVYVFVFLWSLSFIILGSHNPFIYFNF
jgi:D-alanyl-lipoteichoic acid acyltransferase DltB (MBOAT superfamily)